MANKDFYDVVLKDFAPKGFESLKGVVSGSTLGVANALKETFNSSNVVGGGDTLNLSEEQKINRTLELIETSKQIFLVKQELKQKRSDPNKVLTGDQKTELFLLTDGIEITQSKVLSGITATMQEGFNKGTAKFVVENAEAIGMLLYDTVTPAAVLDDATRTRNKERVEGIAYLVTHLDELPEQIATDFKNDLKAAKQKIDAGDLEGGMKIFGELTANLYSSVLNTGAGALKLTAGITKAIGKVGKKVKAAGVKTIENGSSDIAKIDIPKSPVEIQRLPEFDQGTLKGQYNALSTNGPLDNDLAKTFSGAKYAEIELDKDVILYRAGTSDKPFGQFFTKTPPDSIIKTRIDSAVLPKWPNGGISPIDSYFEIKIPKGTKVYVGEVSSQGGFYVGGTQQIVVKQPWAIEGVEILGRKPLK